MRRLENNADIEKIKAVFFKVRKSLPFVPFIAHSYCVHNLCLRVKKVFRGLGGLIILA